MALTRTYLKETRTYDHLYDPTYVTSDAKDHSKLTSKAVFSGANVERVSEHKYFFSELAHYPRHTIRFSQKGGLPEHVDTSWNPPRVADDAHDISGKHRVKYHKRPLVPSLGPTPHIVMYEIRQHSKKKEIVVPDEPTRTIGTQSVYRESEAQTLPYSPEYTVRPNENPEILTLSHLTYGNGLPASEAEVEVIERTRQKRFEESLLPPATDAQSFALRTRLMAAAEMKEWAERERQIEELQNRRIEILTGLLEKREKDRISKGEEKVERLKKKKEWERDCMLNSLQRRRIKVLRQAFKKKSQLEVPLIQNETGRRDVIKQYTDHSTSLYASKLRDGHKPETNTGKIEVQPSDLNSYADLIQLERSLPAHHLRVELENELEPAVIPRKEQAIRRALKCAADKMEAQASQAIEGDKTNDTAVRKHKDRGIQEQEEEPPDEELETAVLFLQRLLRGRAAQTRMYEGKEKRLALIRELEITERAVEDTRKTVSSDVFNEEAKQAIVENITGTVVAKTLDELSKELIRFQEERRIAVMVKLAERDRRLRQAQESGRRQAEERLREREDEMFRQIMDVHQGTIDSYLEDIITSTVEQSAKSRALADAKQRAENINKVVDQLEATSDAEQVRDLVSSFVLPYVERQVVQRRIQSVEEPKYRIAAREALEAARLGVEKNLLG